MSLFAMKFIIKQNGLSNGARCLREQGIPFEVAYFAIFGRNPEQR